MADRAAQGSSPRQPFTSSPRILAPPFLYLRRASMDGNEDPLAVIPTEQLVLTLLRELASRVERLENTEKGETERGVSASTTTSSFEQKLLNDELLNTGGTFTPQDAYHECASEDRSFRTPDTLSTVPYGLLLDGEDVSMSLKRSGDRLNRVSEPEVAKLLGHLGGIVQVPADFRFELTNFWALDIAVQKEILNGAMNFLDVLEQKGGSYWITDHDLKSNQVLYEYKSASDSSLEIPLDDQNRMNGKEKSSLWRRVM